MEEKTTKKAAATGLRAHAAALRALQQDVATHRLQAELRDAAAWRIFMEHHVFAVWDFMSLLKRIQRDLTCVSLPWRPSARPEWARLINDIVLEEETDEDGRGGYRSHFELYLEAMEDVGASTTAARRLIDLLNADVDTYAALEKCGAPPAARAFSEHTLNVALEGETHEVAAVFLWGRESLLPDVFARMVPMVTEMGQPAARLEHYLRRHIELDGDSHGPAAASIMAALDTGPGADGAFRAAERALRARLDLFDGICAALAARRP